MNITCCYPKCNCPVRESLFDDDAQPICEIHRDIYRGVSYRATYERVLSTGVKDISQILLEHTPIHLRDHVVGYDYPDGYFICEIYLRIYDYLIVVPTHIKYKYYKAPLGISLVVRNQFYFKCRNNICSSKLSELVCCLILYDLRVCQDSYLNCIPKDIVNIIRILLGNFIYQL
jgi:hypothetical protein